VPSQKRARPRVKSGPRQPRASLLRSGSRARPALSLPRLTRLRSSWEVRFAAAGRQLVWFYGSNVDGHRSLLGAAPVTARNDENDGCPPPATLVAVMEGAT
jgi:hypothetical protein